MNRAMVGVLGLHLMGPWWCARSDTQREVATAATRYVRPSGLSVNTVCSA